MANYIVGLGFYVLIGIGIWVWWVGGISKAILCFKYWVTPDKIYMDAEPHDCDYNRAPLGDKGCHYRPVVSGFSSDGVQVMVRGKLVSHVTVTSISVSWEKVTD